MITVWTLLLYLAVPVHYGLENGCKWCHSYASTNKDGVFSTEYVT